MDRDIDAKKLDFSNDQIRAMPSYKAWLKLSNNADDAMI